MALSHRIAVVAAAALSAACAFAAHAEAAPAGCGASSYSYAGVLSPTARFGVGARLAAVRRPTVAKGHVAAWVGVGGSGLGPNGTDEWLQVGISAKPGQEPALYYELALPNRAARFVMLKGHVPVGKAFDVAVLEAQAHPGSWQVWVNGTAMTRRLFLPGSHGAWRPMVTAESWNGDTAGTCNGYAFRFGQVRVATRPGGAWQAMTGGSVLSAPGYRLHRQRDALLAAGGV
jgi:hypothetical protein